MEKSNPKGHKPSSARGIKVQEPWTQPTPMRMVMTLLTLIGFWMFGPIGVLYTFVNAGAIVSDGVDGGGVVWAFRVAVALLLLHGLYACVTLPWKTRGPGYVGYLINSIALTAGIVWVIWAAPGVIPKAFGYR